MSICVISQPRFFPGLHYLHRMMVADAFVILDTVQFNPRHEENRTKLKFPQGPQWLTVPMRQLSREQLIVNTCIDGGQNWQRKAIGTIYHLYQNAPFYKVFADEIINILEAPYETLTELDRASWQPALRLLGVTCQFVCSSELSASGRGAQLLLDICKRVGAATYLSGAFGQEYLDTTQFAAEGITVRFQEYSYPVYLQRYGDFVPFLSYLDMLFNVGLERAKVMSGGRILPD